MIVKCYGCYCGIEIGDPEACVLDGNIYCCKQCVIEDYGYKYADYYDEDEHIENDLDPVDWSNYY